MAGETVQSNVILECWVFLELVNEGLPLPQFVIVSEDSFKQAGKERVRDENKVNTQDNSLSQPLRAPSKYCIREVRDYIKANEQHNAKIFESNSTSAEDKKRTGTC